MHTPPPHAHLFQMISGFAVSQAIFTAARLNIAEHIAQLSGATTSPATTPVPILDLASRASAHPDSSTAFRPCPSASSPTQAREPSPTPP